MRKAVRPHRYNPIDRYNPVAYVTKVSILNQNRVIKSLICLRYEFSFKTRSGLINGCVSLPLTKSTKPPSLA